LSFADLTAQILEAVSNFYLTGGFGYDRYRQPAAHHWNLSDPRRNPQAANLHRCQPQRDCGQRRIHPGNSLHLYFSSHTENTATRMPQIIHGGDSVRPSPHPTETGGAVKSFGSHSVVSAGERLSENSKILEHGSGMLREPAGKMPALPP
jgi:hypothetical protein